MRQKTGTIGLQTTTVVITTAVTTPKVMITKTSATISPLPASQSVKQTPKMKNVAARVQKARTPVTMGVKLICLQKPKESN